MTMQFLNEYEVEALVAVGSPDPIVDRARGTLALYMDWMNNNSDGWVYWTAGRKSAAAMQEIALEQRPATEANYKRALATIRRRMNSIT